MTIIHFTQRRLELYGGTEASGPDAGRPILFVDLIDGDGFRFTFWSGHSYSDALDEALFLQRDFAPIKLIDTMGGAHDVGTS